ncbi:3-isopropylmalate dehydrogenase [Bacillus sp. JZ8]
MKKTIAVLQGDGVGKEVTAGAVNVLKVIADRFDHEFHFEYGLIGGEAIDQQGVPLPDETITLCKNSDAILLGAVGGEKWNSIPRHLRPEQGLLKIRKELDVYANLRPVTVQGALADSSPLKREYVEGVDCMIVRELTGGLYFGRPSERVERDGEEAVVDTLFYKRSEIERILRSAFEMAQKRNGRVTSVDKANVLESSRLWREVAEEVAKDYEDVKLEHMLVDAAAMQLIRNPKYFDVLVTENLFGDILSDEASMLAGSLGMLPSASLSNDGASIYEPVHGSAPDIAGQNKANPIAAILSAAMLLRHSFDLHQEADKIEDAVESVLAQGYRTPDIADGEESVSTDKMVDVIIEAIQAPVAN